MTLIRTDGTREALTLSSKPTDALDKIKQLIGADLLDMVNLRDGRVMCVDDAGYEVEIQVEGNIERHVPVRARKPVNADATELYHAICRPGTTHQIVGDVVVVNDADFA